jgi:hypothetical protein
MIDNNAPSQLEGSADMIFQQYCTSTYSRNFAPHSIQWVERPPRSPDACDTSVSFGLRRDVKKRRMWKNIDTIVSERTRQEVNYFYILSYSVPKYYIN